MSRSLARWFCSILLLSVVCESHAQISKEAHDEKLKSLQGEERVQYILDNFYSLNSDNFENARKLMGEAIAISQKNNWKDKEAYARMYQGVSYYLKGDAENSLPQYLKAYSLFDSLKNYTGLARACNELAVFHRKYSDAAKSYEYLDLAEANALKAGSQKELGTSYEHRALLLNREGKADQAAALYQKVYAIRLAEKDSVSLGYVLLDLSSIELNKGNLKKALDYIEQSTLIRKKIGDRQGLAVNLVNTGETYYSIKDYRKAIQYFKECLVVAKEVRYTDLIQYTYEQLAAAHVQINDYKSAFAFQQQQKAFNDSLFSIEKTKVIADLQTKYETERKEQQIVLQQAELAQQQSHIRQTYIIIVSLVVTVIFVIVVFVLARSRHKRQQQLLIKEKELSVQEAYIMASVQSQENERKRFAQDLHDGMGQLISALRLSLLSVNRDSTLESRVQVVNKAEGLLNEMHHEIRSIAFNLMPQTLVQQGLYPALKEMADRVNSTGHMIIRVQSFDIPERFSEVQEISMYRVIQEWINNVIKYSTARVVEVQLVGHENEINITIEDNGNGFDPAVLEQSKGNGWKNIRSRVKLVKGVVEIDSNPGRKGTTLILKVPVRERQAAIVEKESK